MLVYSNFSFPSRLDEFSAARATRPRTFNFRFRRMRQIAKRRAKCLRPQEKAEKLQVDRSQTRCATQTNRRKRKIPLSGLKSGFSQAFAAPPNACFRPEELRKDELVFPKSRVRAHEILPHRTQNFYPPQVSAHFQRNAPMRNFILKTAQTTRRKGGAAAFIAGFAKRPALRRPNASKKRPLSRFPKAGRGRESGLCAFAKSLNTSICTR